MIPRTLFLALLLVAAQCLAADPQEERFKKVLASIEAAKAAKLQAMDANIQTLINRKAGAAIRKARAERDALAKSSEPFVGTIEFPLKVGTAGRLLAPSARIVQVIGPTAMLANMQLPITLPPNSAGLRPDWRNNVLIMFDGIDTTGFADDTEQKMMDAYEVAGTKTYTTVAGGSSTVVVLKPFDLKAFEAWRKAKK